MMAWRQTLHLATIPAHVTEQDIIDEFSLFGEVPAASHPSRPSHLQRAHTGT